MGAPIAALPVERDPALAFALAGCAYRCDRGGEHWQVVRDPLPRARLAMGAAADLCGVDIEQITRDDLARLHAGSRPVRITSETSRRLRIDVEAPTDGMLVLADNFYPGWNCTIDGQESAIEAAHGVFRAVRLEAGPHQVEMRYEPRSFVVGAALSMAGIAVVVLLAAAGAPGLFMVPRGFTAVCCSRTREDSGVTLTSCEASYRRAAQAGRLTDGAPVMGGGP